MHILRYACISIGIVATAANAAEPLTPRYHAAIGVKLHSLTGLTSAYACELPNGEISKYTYDKSIKGPVVAYAIPGYPAHESGIGCGDIITAVDGESTAEPGALQKYIFARAPGTQVTLSLMRPKKIMWDSRGFQLVEHEVGEVQLTLRAQDWLITLRARIEPDYSSFEGRGENGPYYSLKYTTRYRESLARPGDVSHTCELSLDGDLEKLTIESPYLPLMGSQGTTYELQRGQRHLITAIAAIAKEGIPKMMRIPISYRVRVKDEKAVSDNNTVPVQDAADGHWYVTHRVHLECWLPEKRAREIAEQEKVAQKKK